MLNTPGEKDTTKLIDYVDPIVARAMEVGVINTTDEQMLANVKYSTRLGYPQIRTGPLQTQNVVLVGSGPSLLEKAVQETLRQRVWEGAAVVTLNGGYHWCIEHGIRPTSQIVMDSRPFMARFVEPVVPHCRYVVASSCDPAVWKAVEGREEVWIWHPLIHEEGPIREYLDKFYLDNWISIIGGTTVATRAIHLLRTVGYTRFELFGIDCCYLGQFHHAIPQAENKDPWFYMVLGDRTRPETEKTFRMTPWHLKQLEDFLAIMKVNGEHYLLTIHGEGALAYLVRTLGAHVEDLSLRPTDHT